MPILVSAFLALLFLKLPPMSFWLVPILMISWQASLFSGVVAGCIAFLLNIIIDILIIGNVAVANDILFSVLLLSFGLIFTKSIISNSTDLADNASFNISKSAAVAVLPIFVLSLVSVVFVAFFDKIGTEKYLETIVSTFVSELKKTPNSESLFKDANFQANLDWLKTNAIWFFYLTPSLIAIYLSWVIWLNLWITLKLSPNFANIGMLRMWRAPESWFFMPILAGIFLLTRYEVLMAVGINGLFFASFIYFLQGVSLTAYFNARFNIITFWLMLFLFFLMFADGDNSGIYLISLISFFIALGVVDFWLDIRKFANKGSEV